MQRKPPKKRFPHVQSRWSEKTDSYVWRARIRIDGREHVGQWRDSDEQAYADSTELKAKLNPRTLNTSTLLQAARALRTLKQEQGLSDREIKAMDCQERLFLRYWPPDTLIACLTARDVAWFIGEAMRRGRSPNSILKKDLPYLKRLLRTSRVNVACVDEAREMTKRHCKYVPPRMEWFEPDEVREIVRRMREDSFQNSSANDMDLRSRDYHANLVMLVATTGIRSGELARIRVQDINLRRGIIRLIPKDRSNPRDAEILAPARESVERLIARAKENHTDLIVPGGEYFLHCMYQRWKRRLKEPRLNGRTLRHSFGSFVFQMADSPAEARDILGHKCLTTTQRYLHELNLHGRKSLKRIETWWAQDSGSSPGPQSSADPRTQDPGDDSPPAP